MDLFSYPRAPGYRDRDTSRAAATEIAPKAGTLRAKVIEVVQTRPVTPDECAALLGASILSIRPRFTELSRMGRICDSGERRKNNSGKSAIVWKAAA